MEPQVPYAIESIAEKKVVLNKNTHLWNLGQDNFTAIYNNPVEELGKDTAISVVAILHHNIGYTYYLEDDTVPHGINVADCDDYKARPLTPAPSPAVYVPPKGAMRAPVKVQDYYVCKTILGFSAWTKAAQHKDASGTVSQGKYLVFKQSNTMLNLTKTRGQPGYWINPDDNTQDIQR